MKYFLLVFMVVNALVIQAKIDSTKYMVVEELDQEWLVYNKKYSAYVYYLPDQNKNIHIINQWLHTQKYKNYSLSFEAEPELTLFVNHRLIYQNKSDSTLQVYIPIKKFVEIQPKGNVLLTFYNPDYILPFKSTYIVCPATARKSNEDQLNYVIKKRIVQGQISPYILTFLIIVTFIAILRNRYPKRFEEFLGFRNILANTWLEEITTFNVLSMPLFIIVALNALYLSVITSIAGGTPKLLALFSIKANHGMFLQMAIGALLFGGLFVGKYLLINLVGWIFNVHNVIKVQFLEFLKGFLKINTVVVIALLFVISYRNSTVLPFVSLLPYSLAIILGLVTLRTALLILKIGSYRNIYLFSYLCTTEIIPLTIIIKIILFRNT